MARGVGSIPGQQAKIQHAMWYSKNKKQKTTQLKTEHNKIWKSSITFTYPKALIIKRVWIWHEIR